MGIPKSLFNYISTPVLLTMKIVKEADKELKH